MSSLKSSSFLGKSAALLVFLFLMMTFMLSCEKELDINYQDAEAVYVIEGTLNEDGCLVILSQTNNMNGKNNTLPMNNAKVTITMPDGSTQQLPEVAEHRFSAPIHAEAGKTYGLKVVVNGHTFTAQSQMQKPMDDVKGRIIWQKVATYDALVPRFTLTDDSTMENYYYCHVYRSNKSYAWEVASDRWVTEKHWLNYPICFISEDLLKDNKPEDADRMLYVGDTLYYRFRSVDKDVFNYLYALHQNGSRAINPTSNIKGGCYGYFSAFSEKTVFLVLTEELLQHKISRLDTASE